LHDNAKATACKKNTTLSKMLDSSMREINLGKVIGALEYRFNFGYLDEPYSRKTSVTISPAALDNAETVANRLGLSKDLIFRLALENAVDHNENDLSYKRQLTIQRSTQ